ncbi:hypothetical protein ADT71_04520 [Novosphingobium sp. ST904]|nr:hypothetical protein ADT71_04520 [Novosphingobium sp. ST904]TCM25807.1 lipid-binding SYLF domain-containing protein [Novosphingobium sp. ST904]
MRIAYQQITRRLAVRSAVAVMLALTVPAPVLARSSASDIEAKSRAALQELYASNPKAAAVGKRAKGIMIFPHIIKGGLVIAGASGDGVLLKNGKATKFFNISSASVGFQIGAQGFGYALFIMSDQKLAEVSDGTNWDAGSDTGIALIDKGAAASLDTASLNKAIYAFVFSQEGLMAGVSLRGSRIKEIHPK